MWQKIVHWITSSVHENYKLRTSGEHVVYINCFLFLFWHSEQFMYTSCSEFGNAMHWTWNSMNNLLSHCGLVDARISASEKDLPVTLQFSTWKLQAQNMGKTCCVHKLFWMSKNQTKTNLCAQHAHTMFRAFSFHVLNW